MKGSIVNDDSNINDSNTYDNDIRENEGILYLVMAAASLILAVIVLLAGAA